MDPANAAYWDDGGVLYEGTSLICYPAARPGERYEIAEGTVRVGGCAFSYSTLQELLIPVGVRSFDPTALTDCYQLRSVEVSWGNWYYTAWEGVLFTGSMQTLICYPAQKTAVSYRLPAEVKSISIRAFACNAFLRRLEIPGELQELGSLAFLNCSALRRVYFHGDVPENVGFNPFTKDTRVYYLRSGRGWEEADTSEWNLGELQPWAEKGELLATRGRRTQ